MENETPTEQKETTQSNVAEIAELAAKRALESLRAETAHDDDESEEPDYLTKADVAGLLAEERQKIAEGITGKKDKEASPTLKALLTNTESTLASVGEIIEQRAMEKMDAKLSALVERNQATAEILSERPDILKNKENKELFAMFVEKTDETKPAKERFKEAMSKFDAFLESRGEGDSKSRIEKFSSVSSTRGSSDKSDSKEQERKSEAQLLNEEMKFRRDRFKAATTLFRKPLRTGV